MHEFSMTIKIVKSVLQEARKHNAKKVVGVHLVIGQLTFLGIEQVRFSYKVLVKGTIMDGSKLFIERKKGQFRCIKCGNEGSFSDLDDSKYNHLTPTFSCPRCGGKLKITGGRECTIKRLRLVA